MWRLLYLYTLGFPTEWSQYCMGHLIEDDILKRSDFNDERFLFEMAKLLENHPLNNQTNTNSKTIFIPGSDIEHHFISVENKELNDPISVTINCPGGSVDIISSKSHQPLPTEIDITKFIPQNNILQRKMQN